MNIEKNIQQLFEERQDIPLFYGKWSEPELVIFVNRT